MGKLNSANQDYSNNADGWDLSGGVLKRKFKLQGGDIVAVASGAVIYTFPGANTTLVGTDSTQTLSNKTIASPIITGLAYLGGITSSFPAFKRSTTIIQARLGDDSGDAFLQSKADITTAVTVANLPAAPVEGMRCAVTDSNTASFTAGIGAIVAAGGTTHVPVYYDGTNWRIG